LRRDGLVNVAQSTCNIAAKYGEWAFANGTAFFVGPTTLVTAAHMQDGADSEFVAQLPGVHITELNVRNLFSDNPPVTVFRCTVQELCRPIADILILDCTASTYRATTWVTLEQKYIPGGAGIDLIGYPGLYGPQYVLDTQGKAAGGGKQALDDIADLLPTCELTVSYGPVMDNFRTPIFTSYRVSTISGMSGSPVVLNGKVVGKAYSGGCLDK
jgi:hypothetical protein